MTCIFTKVHTSVYSWLHIVSHNVLSAVIIIHGVASWRHNHLAGLCTVDLTFWTYILFREVATPICGQSHHYCRIEEEEARCAADAQAKQQAREAAEAQKVLMDQQRCAPSPKSPSSPESSYTMTCTLGLC